MWNNLVAETFWEIHSETLKLNEPAGALFCLSQMELFDQNLSKLTFHLNYFVSYLKNISPLQIEFFRNRQITIVYKLEVMKIWDTFTASPFFVQCKRAGWWQHLQKEKTEKQRNWKCKKYFWRKKQSFTIDWRRLLLVRVRCPHFK